jgi:hypothetical protein
VTESQEVSDTRHATARRPELTRPSILAYRRTVQALDERLPPGAASLRQAAWAGLQDSMPRAALLSIHARVERTGPSTWEDPSLVQLWGPRFSVYVVDRRDLAAFSLGRFPDDTRGRGVAQDLASRLGAALGDRPVLHEEAARALGEPHNRLRYAATTGTVLIRWSGARQSTIWIVPAPDVEPMEARLDLARRYLHVFGPTTAPAFAEWAGIGSGQAAAAFDALGGELTPVRTPIGDRWILAADEPTFIAPAGPPADARLLPSGDTYFLLQGADRQLLVPEADRRAQLWTSRVWPGAVLVRGDIVGTWRRAGRTVTIQPWLRLSNDERRAVEAEADQLPLPDLPRQIRVRWEP